MNTAKLRFVSDIGSAVLWRIEEHVRSGLRFEEAKAKAIEEAAPAWGGLTDSTARYVRQVAETIQATDMHRDIRCLQAGRHLAEIERARGRKAGWLERGFYRLTGMVF